MAHYRLEVLLPPDERLGYRREIEAASDAEAVARANDFYRDLGTDAALHRYVLYDGERVVHEQVGSLDA